VNATAEQPALARSEATAQLTTAFKRALAAVRRLRGRDTHRPDELSFAQFQLLFALAERGAITTGELAGAAELAPASVTQMLDSLELHELVARSRSKRDRRVVTCSLTPAGRRIVRQRTAAFKRRLDAHLEGFSPEELATAAAVIDRLRTVYDGAEPSRRD
jgi:DNA-binding MarR family transcriptional regulator